MGSIKWQQQAINYRRHTRINSNSYCTCINPLSIVPIHSPLTHAEEYIGREVGGEGGGFGGLGGGGERRGGGRREGQTHGGERVKQSKAGGMNGINGINR